MPRTAAAPTIEPSRKGIIAVSLPPFVKPMRPAPVEARVRGPDAAVLAPRPDTSAALTPLLALLALPEPETPLPEPETPLPEPEPLLPEPEPLLPEPEPLLPEPEPPLPEPEPPLPEPEPPLPEPAPTVPVVVVPAFEPELVIAAAPFEFGEASALELPVMAALVIW